MKRNLFITLFTACALTAQAQFHGGSGTEQDPYLVSDGYDLADIANYRTSYFKQVADIDLTEWIEDNAPTLGWMPIGTTDAPFQGSFDGGGYTIYGLNINRPTNDYIGLFGYVTGGLNISNINIEAPSVKGQKFVGVIAGYSEATISNCCVQSATIQGNGDYVGGICGYSAYNANGNNITGNRVNIFLLSGLNNVGGIVGEVKYNVSVSNNEVTALKISGYSNVGGIAGKTGTGSTVSRSIAIVERLVATNDCAGGIVGLAQNAIEGCYSFANISAGITGGGICGYGGKFVSYSKTQSSSSWPSAPSGSVFYINSCVYDGTITSNKSGGIIGTNLGFAQGTKDNRTYTGSYYTFTFSDYREGAAIRSCLVRNARISAQDYVAGIEGYQITLHANANVENCVSLATLVSCKTTENAFRIVGNDYGKNNKAYNKTELIQNNKKVLNIEDNAQNGTAYGEKTLMRSSAYTGLGWDFNTVWTIQEGESYPYFQTQSDYPVVTEMIGGNKANIAGTCKSNGRLTIIKKGSFVNTPIVDNKWEANLGAVNSGDTLLIYAQAEGKMPSIVVRYVADGGGVNPDPQGIVGDANGDGLVDAADVTAIINFILGKPSSSFNRTNADVNSDGQILIDDAVQTVQIIMDAQ